MTISADGLGRLFHEAYERLAPEHGYKTREASAVPWEDVPEGNRGLMVATCAEVLQKLDALSDHGRRDALADRSAFVLWRNDVDCAFLLDVFDLALGWFSGRGYSHDDALEMARLMQDIDWNEAES